jgi:hypothetical protein
MKTLKIYDEPCGIHQQIPQKLVKFVQTGEQYLTTALPTRRRFSSYFHLSHIQLFLYT